jgi:hypothetical protein
VGDSANMASTYEKSVKGQFNSVYILDRLTDWVGATKVKLAAPKPKYIEHLLMATQVCVSEFEALIPGRGSGPGISTTKSAIEGLYVDGTLGGTIWY